MTLMTEGDSRQIAHLGGAQLRGDADRDLLRTKRAT